MASELVEFWRTYKPIGPPFVHPKDKSLGQLPKLTRDCDFIEFSRDPEFSGKRLHTSLMPVPFSGDIEEADIFILLLNPGLSHADIWGEENSDLLRHRLKANLRQSVSGFEYPFFWLDPEICWHGGFRWWERKLRATVLEIAKAKFSGNYLEATKSLSRRLACLELIPYHSHTFAGGQLCKLESAKVAKRFAKEFIESSAKKGKKTVIVTRGAKEWELENEEGSTVIYRGAETRGASLSPQSRGGCAILKRYGLS